VTTLKRGSLYRIPLAADGKTLNGPIERYFQSENRFRDTALSPDKKTIYVATDNGGLAEKMGGGTTTTMQNPGSIIAFTYKGDGEAVDTTTPSSAPPDQSSVAGTGGGAAPTFTTAQDARGTTAYLSNCATCHGPNLASSTYGTPLAGKYFVGKWGGHNVGELFAYAKAKMPPSRPAGLPDQSYVDIIAHVLAVNGVPAGDKELPVDPAELGGMTIPDVQ
jgi:mono/diheme cytochrome c family protein